jgi:NAD(P)-dependent dehydrogenase (short-subunit alcohol dehydrogenase family)
MNFLITGGASGLGYAITTAVAAQYPGSIVYFTFCSSVAGKEQLEKEFSNTKGIKCDFFKATDIDQLIEFIKTNPVEVLVNNAVTGIKKQYAHKLNAADVIDAFRADVLPVVQITGAFIHSARQRKSGKIITILSAAIAHIPPTGWSVYVANKNYLLSMHKSWAAENKQFNISSNCISPDFMLTPLNGDEDERIVETMIAKHPLKKLLTVEEVAKTVIFLCDASAQLNGQDIILNAAQF